jgi:hypothetical protein
MQDSMAVILTIEDPEGTEPVANAYGVITEIHANFKTKSLVVIFECWRSKAAFVAERRSFTAIQLRFDPDKGGTAFFERYGVDGAAGSMGENILSFCLSHSDVLKEAKPAWSNNEPS